MFGSKELLFFFSGLGAFNGLILSCYFFFVVKKKSLANYFLGALLLSLSLRIGKSVAFYFNCDISKFYLQVGLSACFLIGPMLYFFVKSSKESVKLLPNHWKYHILLLLAILVFGGIIYPYTNHPKEWGKIVIPFIYTVWLIYIILSVISIKDVISKIFKKGESLEAKEIWLVSIILSNILIWLLYFQAYLGNGIYIAGAIVFSFAIYSGALVLMFRHKAEDLFSGQGKNIDKKINPNQVKEWDELLNIFINDKKLYKNSNLKIQNLADEMKISSHQLSQFLNEHKGKNFSQYINDHRIEEACHLLETNNLLSIEGIADEVGFNSKSTFFTSFKKSKGMTPASYKQQFSCSNL